MHARHPAPSCAGLGGSTVADTLRDEWKKQVMNDLLSLWQVHRDADWPKMTSPHEGELMTLDTVISGCVTYFLESEEGLDLPRVEILQSCLSDLDHLLPDLAEEACYFERLQALAQLLLSTTHSPQ